MDTELENGLREMDDKLRALEAECVRLAERLLPSRRQCFLLGFAGGVLLMFILCTLEAAF